MGDAVIRQASAGDAAALVALLADDVRGVTRETPGDLDPYRRALARILEDPDQLLLVAERAGAVVGMAQLTFIQGLAYRGGVRAQIESVHVSSAERGRGLGSALVEHAVARARQRGCVMAQLTSHADRVDAHRFYARLGFTASHVGFKLRLSSGGPAAGSGHAAT
jgi:ribosomal protein S18 acetylase RimI-like enzyme